MSEPKVGILMGSKSDWEIMRRVGETLDELGIPHESRVLSAHRTPDETAKYAREAVDRGIEVLVCGAGCAAHLAGVVAAHTVLPVLGVPIDGGPLKGMDALLATVQMPGGIPVGTLAIGKAGATNAALLAASIMGTTRPDLREKLWAKRRKKAETILSTTL